MFYKKILSLVLFSSLVQVSLYAKQQDADMVSYKDYKEKKTTSTVKRKDLKEKVNINPIVKSPNNIAGSLKGQIAKENFLNKGTMINTNKYENIKNTDIYRVENKVYRISRNTKEILDVLK